MLRRSSLIIWTIACLYAAVNSSLLMFADFAPKHAGDAERAGIETAAVERVRGFWMVPVLITSGLLAITSVVLLVQGWRRTRTRRIMRHAGTATDLPADASTNLEHYLYGHPKRE